MDWVIKGAIVSDCSLRTGVSIYKYVFRAVGCFPGPYLAKRFNRSEHKLKYNRIVQGELVHPQGWLQ